MRKGDTTLRLIDKAASLKKLIKKVEKRKVCLGGTDLERELAKALDIMADVVLVQGCAMNIVRKMQDFLMFSKISKYEGAPPGVKNSKMSLFWLFSRIPF